MLRLPECHHFCHSKTLGGIDGSISAILRLSKAIDASISAIQNLSKVVEASIYDIEDLSNADSLYVADSQYVGGAQFEMLMGIFIWKNFCYIDCSYLNQMF